MHRREKYLVVTIIVFVDIAITLFSLKAFPFVDSDDLSFYFSPVCVYLSTLFIWFLCFISIKKIRNFVSAFYALISNLLLSAIVFYTLFAFARAVGLVHVCSFRYFKSAGYDYLLLFSESNGKLVQDGYWFLFDRNNFKYAHDSWYMCHNGPYLCKGTLHIYNDTLVRLYRSSGDMAIIGHIAPDQPTCYERGIADTFANRYLVGFPKAGDTVALDGGSALLGAYR